MSQATTFPARLHMRPAKTQVSLCIYTGWSESSLSAWRRFGSLITDRVPCEDSGQTARMRRLTCLRWAKMQSCRKSCAPAEMFSDDKNVIKTLSPIKWKCAVGSCANSKGSAQTAWMRYLFRAFTTADRIMGYYRMYEWRAKARMILCACAWWSESTNFVHVWRHFFGWRDPVYIYKSTIAQVSTFNPGPTEHEYPCFAKFVALDQLARICTFCQ